MSWDYYVHNYRAHGGTPKLPVCRSYDCLALKDLSPDPTLTALTVSAEDPVTWEEWFPIPGFDLYSSGSPPLTDFDSPGVESELLPESARATPIIDPCAGPLLSVLRLRSGSRIEYTPGGTGFTLGVWSLKGGTTANDYPNTVGSINGRVLDPVGTPRGAGFSIQINIIEVGSLPLSQFSVDIAATGSIREASTSDPFTGTTINYGPYTTNPIASDNIDSWILSGFDILTDVPARFTEGPNIIIPVQLKVYLAWNGGEETATIVQDLEWLFGTAASGTIDTVRLDTIRVAQNNVRVGAFGATDFTPLTPADFESLVLGWRRSREDYIIPPDVCS